MHLPRITIHATHSLVGRTNTEYVASYLITVRNAGIVILN